MTAKQIHALLHPTGLLFGCNLYPGEPTSSHHSVSIKKGHATQVMALITQAGGHASHAYAFGPYSESIHVRR